MERLHSSTEKKSQNNGEILNKPTENGMPSPKAAKLKLLRKSREASRSSILFAVIRFWLECIVSNFVLIPLLLSLLPVLAVYIVIKLLEQMVVRFTRGSVPMSGLDAIWQQSNEKNRLIITTLFVADFEGEPDKTVGNLRKILMERMVDAKDENGKLIYPRCRWLVRPGYFQYFFEEDTNFSIDKHVFKWDGEIPCSKEALEDIVSKLSADPLPQGRAPWFYCCIPTNFGDKSMAVVFRMHHSIADGVSLSRFLIHKLPDNVSLEKEARKFSSHDRTLLSVKAAFVTARCLVKLLFNWADRSVLHGPDLSGAKRVAWSEPLDLKRVKEIKNATGTTVNDVLMACLSAALRKYQQKKGVHSPDDVIASIPVDVRPFNKTFAFENKFAIIFLKLPVGVNGTVQQLLEMKSRMDYVKTSGEPLGMAWAMQLTVALFPEFISKPLLTFLSDKATSVVSNVPGPQNSLIIGGCPVNYMTFWPPQRDSIGMGVSIFSYGGQVQVGVQGDATVLSEPQQIIQEFDKALEDLENCTIASAQTNGCTSGHTNGVANGKINGHAEEL